MTPDEKYVQEALAKLTPEQLAESQAYQAAALEKSRAFYAARRCKNGMHSWIPLYKISYATVQKYHCADCSATKLIDSGD